MAIEVDRSALGSSNLRQDPPVLVLFIFQDQMKSNNPLKHDRPQLTLNLLVQLWSLTTVTKDLDNGGSWINSRKSSPVRSSTTIENSEKTCYCWLALDIGQDLLVIHQSRSFSLSSWLKSNGFKEATIRTPVLSTALPMPFQDLSRSAYNLHWIILNAQFLARINIGDLNHAIHQIL